MVDVDGVLIKPRPGGWAVDMESDLGLSPATLAEHFFAMHYSADLGCGKPDLAFFARVGERTGLAPDEMVLIDDKVENVEAAWVAGWRGVLWTGKARLGDVLALA